jgi:hypothetical protein
MQRTAIILSAFASVSLLGPAMVPAQAAGSASIIQADALTWAPAQGVPPGAQVAVLYGNPSKKGPFAIRFKFPAGYEIPTHSHATDEFRFRQGPHGIRQGRRCRAHPAVSYWSLHDFAR